MVDKIKNLPSGNILCHGDFHPYNIILTSERDFVIILEKMQMEYSDIRVYIEVLEILRRSEL